MKEKNFELIKGRNKRPEYYAGRLNQLAKLGYTDPSIDSDPNQREIWNHIVNHDLDILILPNHDYLSQLASRNDPHYAISQARAECEDPERVRGFYNAFYLDKIPMKRIPIGVSIDGKHYVGSGNQRAQAHKMGQTIHGFDTSTGGIMLVATNLSPDEQRRHLLAIAALSNRDNDDQTAPETGPDIAHQLKQAFGIDSQLNVAMQKWSEEERCQWGHKWIKDHKPHLASEHAKVPRGNIVNQAFRADRGQSLPFPEKTEEIDDQFSKFFPNNSWNGEEENTEIYKQFEVATHWQQSLSKILKDWHQGEHPTTVRATIDLAARCGTMTGAMSSALSAKKERAAYIEKIEDFNKRPRYVSAGFPLIGKILFVRQLSNDTWYAFQWNPQTGRFDPVEPDDK